MNEEIKISKEKIIFFSLAAATIFIGGIWAVSQITKPKPKKKK